MELCDMSFHNKKLFMENKDKFFETFKVGLHNFLDIKSMIGLVAGFGVIAFDDWLKLEYDDYEDGKTSMRDLILDKFGEQAVELIEHLIGAHSTIGE